MASRGTVEGLRPLAGPGSVRAVTWRSFRHPGPCSGAAASRFPLPPNYFPTPTRTATSTSRRASTLATLVAWAVRESGGPPICSV